MAEQKQIETMTSEEIALLLSQQYQALIQIQQNILILNREIEARHQRHTAIEKEITDGKG